MKFVLLDLDGTLIDSTALIMESYRHTLRHHLGIVPADDVLLSGFGTPLYKQLGRFASEGVDEMIETYRAFNIANHDRLVRSFPGVRETLGELAGRGLKMAIVTSKMREISQVGLDLFGLSPFITLMVGVEDTDKHKPDPTPVLKALQLLDGRPEEAVFLGDSPHDMMAGRAAGVKTAAALWGPFDKSVLLACEPDYTLNSISELVEIASQ